MKGRNKAPTPQEANKSKPPVNPPPPLPQLPADLGLKPNPELRRERQHEALEEGEIGPSKGTNNREYLRTKEVGGPPLLKAEKILSRLMCAIHRAYGPLNWIGQCPHYLGYLHQKLPRGAGRSCCRGFGATLPPSKRHGGLQALQSAGALPIP